MTLPRCVKHEQGETIVDQGAVREGRVQARVSRAPRQRGRSTRQAAGDPAIACGRASRSSSGIDRCGPRVGRAPRSRPLGGGGRHGRDPERARERENGTGSHAAGNPGGRRARSSARGARDRARRRVRRRGRRRSRRALVDSWGGRARSGACRSLVGAPFGDRSSDRAGRNEARRPGRRWCRDAWTAADRRDRASSGPGGRHACACHALALRSTGGWALRRSGDRAASCETSSIRRACRARRARREGAHRARCRRGSATARARRSGSRRRGSRGQQRRHRHRHRHGP
jgi:hypothetical protein